METANRLIMDGHQMFVIRDEGDAKWLNNFLETYFPRTKYRYRCDSSEEFFALLISELSLCGHREFLAIFPEIVQQVDSGTVVNEEISLCLGFSDEKEVLEYGLDVRCLITVFENIMESSEDISSFFF